MQEEISVYVQELFDQQVRKTPHNIALIFEDQQISYIELHRRANQLANYLISYGVRAEVSVGIYLDRSLEMIVAMLAIMKAGGAYLPLDLSSP